MKLHHLAAATLLLGSSALAYAATDYEYYDDNLAAHESMWDGAGNMMARSASAWRDAQAMKPVQASAVTWEEEKVSLDKAEAMVEGDPDLDLAEKSIETSDAELAMAAAADEVDPPLDDSYVAEAATVDDPAMAEPAPVTLAAADLTPRPATQNYPACDPGPGDDSCIQLYEPGVRVALASWTAPTGGLSDGTAVAMGGPLDEESADAAATVDEYGEAPAMHGDGLVDTAMGEEAQGEFAETVS